MGKLRAYLRDDSGQTSTEYILLLAVAAMIVFKFKGLATTKLTKLIGDVFDKADEVLQDP